MWIAFVALVVYVVLKGGQIAFLGRAAGYRAEPESLGRRLRKGEPALLVVAILITAPPALAQAWYHKHKFEAVLTESSECYALIQTYQQAPGIKGSASDHAIYEAIYGYRAIALDAAKQLDLDARVTRDRLAWAVSTTIAERRRAEAGIVHERLVAAQSCLHPPREQLNS